MKTEIAKMIESGTRLVNVREINIRTIEEGLERYAKEFAAFVMQPYTTDDLKPEDFEDRIDQFNK